MSLQEGIASVRQRIAQACQRAGRPAPSVTLVAVTKQVPVEAIRGAIALGLTELGENRVQDARDKQLALGSGLRAVGPGPRALSPQPVRWHLIGHLQRNKAKSAVELFEVIHAVDSLPLIEELSRHTQQRERRLDALVQVNVSGEATKHGCPPDEAQRLAEAILAARSLSWRGLMTIAPLSADPEQARPHFRRLRELRDALSATLGVDRAALRLSMGMSQDFEVAIEEGADLVRIGTAIFGAREDHA